MSDGSCCSQVIALQTLFLEKGLSVNEFKFCPWCGSVLGKKVELNDIPFGYEKNMNHVKVVGVVIYKSDETGEMKWVVAVADEPEYWLEAFDTKREAVAFVKDKGLKIVKEL